MAGRHEDIPGVDWVTGTGEFIRVIPELCDGCACCARVCLGDCFEISGGKARLKGLHRCMECASCWYVCPRDAIAFSWPKGGTGFRSDWG